MRRRRGVPRMYNASAASVDRAASTEKLRYTPAISFEAETSSSVSVRNKPRASKQAKRPQSEGSTRAKRVDAQRNYQHVLDAARIVLAEQGADASVRDVARKAGVGLGTLYRHFPTRDALLEATLRQGFDRLAKKGLLLEKSDDPLAALTTWLRDLTGGASVYKGLISSMMATIQDPGSPLHASCMAMQEAGGRLLKRAQNAGSIRADVSPAELFAMIGAVAWMAEHAATSSARARMLSLIMGGLESRD